MGKDIKIKNSVSSPPYKVWENYFRKKALHGLTNVFRRIYGGMFYMEANDQIMQVEKLMLKRFQSRVKLIFLSLTLPEMSYPYII